MDEARGAFNKLKEALTSVLVLAFPNFKIPFLVETNACDVGIGEVLL